MMRMRNLNKQQVIFSKTNNEKNSDFYRVKKNSVKNVT